MISTRPPDLWCTGVPKEGRGFSVVVDMVWRAGLGGVIIEGHSLRRASTICFYRLMDVFVEFGWWSSPDSIVEDQGFFAAIVATLMLGNWGN